MYFQGSVFKVNKKKRANLKLNPNILMNKLVQVVFLSIVVVKRKKKREFLVSGGELALKKWKNPCWIMKNNV